MSAATDPTDDQLARARGFAARQWRPFPCEPRGKRPIETSPGTRLKWGTACATAPAEGMLALWFGGDPVNIGIAAKPSRLVFLDADREGAMEDLCGAYGQEIPQTYRVRTSKGWHYYFDAPQHVEISNAPGPLAAFGFDVRGGRGEGGYVIAAGSIHASGHVYTAEDDDADTIELPWWLVELLLPAPEPEGVTTINAEPRGDRRYTREQARDWIERYAAAPLRLTTEADHNRNNSLNTAAIVVGHFIPGYLDEQAARKRLAEMAREIGLEGEEIGKTINSGLRAGMRQPYVIVTDAETVDGEEPTAEEIAERKRARLIAEELERLDVREEARRLHSAATQPELLVMRGAKFLEGDDLEYLVPGLFYFSSTSKIYGPPGGGKTNFALDVAMCAATGTPWRGEHELPRTRVHFVMAEGESVNRLRVRAFLHKHDVKAERLDGWFTAVPQGVLLTPEGIRAYLQVVREERPGLVFLDTKNAMMDGDENSASDVAVMIRAMREIRDAGERCAVVLIDHTGIADETRGRGSNAVMAAMDTEVRVSKEVVDGIVTFTAAVTRDKAAPETRSKFPFTLWPVEVERPDGVAAPPVVVVDDVALKVLERDRRGAAAEDVTPIEPPAKVVNYSGEGHQAIVEVAVICMRHGRGSTGVSLAAVKTYYRAEHPKTPAATAGRRVARAWDALYGMGCLTPVLANTELKTGASFWVEDRPSDVE